jgi:hypothetical protein
MAKMKKEADGEHPAGHYLVVGDPEEPSTWHLRVRGPDGKPDHGLMGAAHAALHEGFRGNRYEGPDKEQALAKLKALYAAEKMPWPEAAKQQLLQVVQSVALGDAKDARGKVWEVEITQYAETKAGLEWPREVCARDAQAFQHRPSHSDHVSEAQLREVGHSIRDLIGWIENPVPGDAALLGELHLLEPEVWAPKLRAIQKAPPGVAGMSLDALVAVKPTKRNGRTIQRVEQIARVLSVDLVSGPAGGGRIIRAVASVEEFLKGTSPTAESDLTARTKTTAGGKMKERILQFLQAIKRFDPAKAGQLETEIAALDENEQLERVTQALVAIEPPKVAEPAKTEPAVAALSAEDRKVLADATREIKQAQTIQCEAILQMTLSKSGLPVPLVEEIERRFKGKVFEKADLEEDITQVRQTYARVVPAHRVTDPSVRVTLENQDKLQIALDKSFGLSHEIQIETDARGFQTVKQGGALPHEIPAFRGIREAYVTYTGDPDISGKTNLTRISQIFNTAGFPYALAATLNRLLLRDYAAVDYRWREIVTAITSPSDFRAQERIRTGYFGDLATVTDEEYDEITAYTDEKISYAVGTKGNIATVSRRAIMNDDIQAISGIVGKLGRSAARTLAKFIWAFAIDNASYDADATGWFHADHGNLGATTISGTIATDVGVFNVADLAFFNMTEKDSAEKLALTGPYLLVVPKAIHSKAIMLNQAMYSDAIFTPNPWYHKFGANDERIYANPLFGTEANDWILFDVSGAVDILELGFLQGRQMPEFFQADNPTVDMMFTSDKLRYKVRHEYSGDILDYRGAYKAVVT